jgi:hypothetical protein
MKSTDVLLQFSRLAVACACATLSATAMRRRNDRIFFNAICFCCGGVGGVERRGRARRGMRGEHGAIESVL